MDQDSTGIAWLLKHRGIGLTVLQDTRLRTTDKQHCGHILWQKTIGDNALVTFSKCNDDAGIIGGQAFLMDPFWASKRQSTWSDPSELGITPTYAECFKVIKESNDNGAGGPSGLTYSRILKDLPDEVLIEFYIQLAEVWAAFEIQHF